MAVDTSPCVDNRYVSYRYYANLRKVLDLTDHLVHLSKLDET